MIVLKLNWSETYECYATIEMGNGWFYFCLPIDIKIITIKFHTFNVVFVHKLWGKLFDKK